MLALVTLSQVKARLRYLHTDADTELQDMIYAASAMVVDYLGSRADSLLDLDSGGDLVSGAEVLPQIERATLECVAWLDRGDDEMKARPGGLPFIAEAMLYRLADPPLA